MWEKSGGGMGQAGHDPDGSVWAESWRAHCAGPQEPGRKLDPAISVPPSPLQPPVTFPGIHLHHPISARARTGK